MSIEQDLTKDLVADLTEVFGLRVTWTEVRTWSAGRVELLFDGILRMNAAIKNEHMVLRDLKRPTAPPFARGRKKGQIDAVLSTLKGKG